MKYCNNPFAYQRRKTRVVYIGDVGVGGDNPIRVQSMTITDTLDTRATVEQTVQLYEAGCEIVRITAPSLREAENLKHIKNELLKQGVTVPLVADIHYTPNAALVAADYVEKVRINPGNYADKKKFEHREYSDTEYLQELQRIEERFKPLVLKCKALGRALRIGTNHGSLSDRIMNRYGDTPEGMMESALEFVRICQKYDFHDIVLSMKASNPQVAIQAYRLLAARMDELGLDYPFHLGVTEAGDGEEGRIKSAVGIGSLLEDGIGDTVRVSLTEDPVAEVPVALQLVKKFNQLGCEAKQAAKPFELGLNGKTVKLPNPFVYSRRETLPCNLVYHRLGHGELPRVELSLPEKKLMSNSALGNILLMAAPDTTSPLNVVDRSNLSNQYKCETLHLSVESESELLQLEQLKNALFARGVFLPLAVDVTQLSNGSAKAAALADRLVFAPARNADGAALTKIVRLAQLFGKLLEWKLGLSSLGEADRQVETGRLSGIRGMVANILEVCEARDYWNVLFSLAGDSAGRSIIAPYRYLAGVLDALGANLPILLRWRSHQNLDAAILEAASQLGSLLCDGIGDAIHIESNLQPEDLLRLSYNILQATRLRMTRADFISCPSCGRTLFDLQTTTERIKSKTGHLKGVKIAIMGCIVNGPGEMADADFGYVGAGPQKVNLFVGKECVERNVPEQMADERLIELIKAHGKWVAP
ncbi:MAG: (E)-4-hydroxy-3-methylbut-2-enyl-diphosphate synthase [bacterium]